MGSTTWRWSTSRARPCAAIIERHRVLETPVPPAIAAYIASRVCRALDFAHNFVSPEGDRLDIVHRDVSPNNIMATWDGHVKLADFGIAKANTSIDPMQKSPMMLMGKKHYMSPEQLLALDVSGRSDVFAVGVTLYELLALEPLFYEDATELLIDEVTWRPLPSMRELVPDIPEGDRGHPHALARPRSCPAPHRRRDGTRARQVVRVAGGRRDARSAAGAPRDDLHRHATSRPPRARRSRTSPTSGAGSSARTASALTWWSRMFKRA